MPEEPHQIAGDEDEQIQVELMQGEWADALGALNGFGATPDVKPLAALLKRGPPVPEEVTAALGQLLDPPWGNKGPRLVLNDPSRWSRARAVREIGEKRKLRALMWAEYEQVGHKKRVIADFAKQTGRSEAYLRKCWELDSRQTFLALHKILTEGVGRGLPERR